MDLTETIRKMVLAANSAGEIAIDLFNELRPPEMSSIDLERLIESLNSQDIWIVEE